MQSSLSHYILLAKRWAWVVLLGVAICSGTTYIITKLIPPTYVATTYVVIKVTTSQSSNDNTLAAVSLIPSFNQVITNDQVLQPVALKYGLTVKQLAAMITTRTSQTSVLMQIDVSNRDATLAKHLADEVANSFSENYLKQTYEADVTGKVLPAIVPALPAQPKPTTDALIGAVVGLGLALAIIVIFEWIDDRLSSPEEVQKLLGLEALTIIPELSRKQRTKNAEETPELAEGCRILCANLNMAQMIRPFKLVMVTSALAGEGKSTISANIASFLAMSGKRVLLVDADLRHPVLDQHFQLENRQGLSNAFLEMWAQVEVGLDGQPTEIPSLRVLTAGVLPSNPSELLQSQLAQQLFNHFRNSQKFDYVIFDAPPVLPIADAQILATYVQVTILVVDASKTPRKALVRAKQALSRTGTRILGVAINKSQWPDFGEVQDYLSNIQQRPRADITMSMPPNMPNNNRMDATNTAILPANKR